MEINIGDLSAQDGLPVSIWLKPRSEDGTSPACLSVEMVGGPKRYVRLWLTEEADNDWGWSLHESAVCLFRDPAARSSLFELDSEATR